MEVSGQLHAPTTFLCEKEPTVPLDKRVGAPHSRSGPCGEKKNYLPFAVNRTPAVQPVSVPKKKCKINPETNMYRIEVNQIRNKSNRTAPLSDISEFASGLCGDSAV
jgi:hypothetical protein